MAILFTVLTNIDGFFMYDWSPDGSCSYHGVVGHVVVLDSSVSSAGTVRPTTVITIRCNEHGMSGSPGRWRPWWTLVATLAANSAASSDENLGVVVFRKSASKNR